MCAAENYRGQTINDGYGTLRRFRRRISSILTIPEYLSEIQLFQMRNVSVKTKNGLKDAQKNVKGRPSGRGKDVIMNSEQPPKVPGKDYHHYTPDIDDDGWGSDFSENSQEDGYIEPVPDEVYEDPDGAGSCDSEYEEPTPRTDMPQTKKKNAGENLVNKRLPPQPKPPQQPIIFPGARKLPPDPPQDDGENYEIPDATSYEPEDYEQPDGASPPPPQLHPRHARLSPPPPKPVVTAPPRIPRRDIKPKAIPEPEKTTQIPTGPTEDYEEPAMPTKPSSIVERCEIVSTAGRLKPSNIRPAKTNYPKHELKTTPPQPVRSWADSNDSDIIKPSQLRNKNIFSNARTPQKNMSTATENVRPGVNSSIPQPKSPKSKSPVAQRKAVAKPPEKQKDVDGLYSYTWYHGDMTRDQATRGLQAKAQNGMFLVRKSTQSGSPYALSLFYERVYNLNIRLRPDKKYALGNAKKDEKAFGSVPVLISYFQNNTLLLGGNESTQTTLIQALPK